MERSHEQQLSVQAVGIASEGSSNGSNPANDLLALPCQFSASWPVSDIYGADQLSPDTTRHDSNDERD